MSTTIIHLAYPPARGILLNPSPSVSPARPPTPLPLLVPSHSASSSSASSSPSRPPSDADYFLSAPSALPSPAPAAHPLPPKSRSGSPAGRRIRFAPLPEPRRDDPAARPLPAVLVDDADALPLDLRVPFEDSVTHGQNLTPNPNSNAHPSPRLPPAPYASGVSDSTLSLLGSHALSRVSSSNTITAPARAPTPNSAAPALTSSDVESSSDADHAPVPAHTRAAADSPRRSKWSKKLLKPLLGPLAKGPAPCASAPLSPALAPPDAPAAAAASKKRARSGSRGSAREDGAKEFGLPLGRWHSDDQPRHAKRNAKAGAGAGGVEFTRTQSLDREREALNAGLAPLSRTGSGSAGRKQQRMLNGRVYGAKRAQNLFASAKPEPEFVEWGYGGTGSVQASKTGANYWAKVQAAGSLSVGATEAPAGWARSRSPHPTAKQEEEARAGAVQGKPHASAHAPPAADDDGSGMAWVRRRREQREREKREREEREKMQGVEGAPADSPVGPELGDEAAKNAQDAQDAPPAATVQAPGQEEHVTTTVTLPAHHRSHSIAHSIPHDAKHEAQPPAVLVDGGAQDGARTPSDEEAIPADEGSGSGSDEQEDDNDEQDKEDGEESPNPGEDEEELEEELEELRRLTARGAGVEKISRHKEAAGAISP